MARFAFLTSMQAFWSAATCRRFQKARHVAPAAVRTVPQTPKKRRPAGVIQNIERLWQPFPRLIPTHVKNTIAKTS
jgi:hypothetical protein